MKKWLFIAGALLLLTACNDETETPVSKEASETFSSVIDDHIITVTAISSPNEDVQAVIDITDPSTFASLIYSLNEDSYLLLHSDDQVTVHASDTTTTLELHITHTGTRVTDDTLSVYAISFEHPYDTIQLFEDGEEIPFEIWTE